MVCMHACIYVCMYVCLHACMYVCMHACMYGWIYVCMYFCMHACMHALMYVCMYACMRGCLYLCMCVWYGMVWYGMVWISIYIYIYIDMNPYILHCNPNTSFLIFLPNHLDHPQPEGSKDMLRSSRVDGCDSDPSARPPWEAFCNQRAAEQERKHRWCNGATVGVQAHWWSS